MRGSQVMYSQFKLYGGIIPAHAGLTKEHLNPLYFNGDHPRACGAHIQQLMHADSIQGSSPRMRGSPLFNFLNSFF